jgi:uncharacterized membrane protein HdeD (DUF308 family)
MAHTDLQQPASPLSALAWGALVIGGIFAIIIGLVAIIWPSVTFTVLVVLLGVYAFVSGLFTVLAGVVWPPGWGLGWLMVLEGVLGIVVGVLIFLRPESAAIALIYLIAAWAIITGVLQIVQALGLRRVIEGEWALMVGGLASVIFGVLLAVWPKEGLIALVWIFGVFALVYGVMHLVLAHRVRRMDVA